MTAAIRACLPGALCEHCQSLSVAESRLTVVLDSPVWATRARFMADELLKSLSNHGIQEIRFTSQPGNDIRPTPREGGASPRHRLSDRAVNHLLDAASHLDDPELGSAFKRFALRHSRKTSGSAD